MSDHREQLKNNYDYPNLVVYEKNDLIEKLKVNLRACEFDYWFMINLLEGYSSNKDEVIKYCIERMKFRKPLFEVARESSQKAMEVLK